jgi:hypothetical protein
MIRLSDCELVAWLCTLDSEAGKVSRRWWLDQESIQHHRHCDSWGFECCCIGRVWHNKGVSIVKAMLAVS